MMIEPVRIFIGYDQREAVAYHACCQSLIANSSKLLQITPLALNHLRGYHERHGDGSNAFIYSRFLIPFLCDYSGWAIYLDGDMIVRDDIAKLWRLRDPWCAVQVVQQTYKTKFAGKYLANSNVDYPRKNWSSVILWNCSHYANRKLTPDLVQDASGADLHRFTWIPDERIGALPPHWNHLVMEHDRNDYQSLYHYTIGTPCFPEYADCEHANYWWDVAAAMTMPLKLERPVGNDNQPN
jgi:lipopolysaccharide biosynthesis glycosyltransferase